MTDPRAADQVWTLEPVPEERTPLSGSLYPPELRKQEEALIGRRPRIGVALSGGGIRSATLSLGFFQGLASRSLLRHVDILSTVSGGGYFGAFFGHLVRRAPLDGRATPEGQAREEVVEERRAVADEVLRDPNARAVRFLRDNGRYLAPEGTGDLLAAGAVALRNWLSILIVLGIPILAAAAIALLVRLTLETFAARTLEGATLAWPVWLSPYFLLAALAVPILAVPPGWAYWLVPDRGRGSPWGRALASWLAPVAAVALVAWLFTRPGGVDWGPFEVLIAVVGGTAGLTMVCYGLASVRRAEPAGAEPSGPVPRNRLSHWLKGALIVIGVLLFAGAVDTVALTIVVASEIGVAGAYAALLGVVGAFRAPLLRLITGLDANERPPALKGLLINVAAVVLLLGVLGGIAWIPHILVASSLPSQVLIPRNLDGVLRGAATRLLVMVGVAGILAFAAGRIWSFVNRSSMHALYEARLRRAYLGASNVERVGEGDDLPPLTEPRASDGMTWMEYARWGDARPASAPLHLINVTINETIDGRSQVQQRDRKGVGMAVGPVGVSVGRTHHARWSSAARPGLSDMLKEVGSQLSRLVTGRPPAPASAEAGSGAAPPAAPARYRVFPGVARPEMLDVGQWVAISGGAVSTGLGARTSLPLSLLCGFFNVRLGYWWDSGVDPAGRVGAPRQSWLQYQMRTLRGSLPVQCALLDEWLARFPGTSRRDWYLSDGGHFENLGAYELLRRRLPFIVVCDNEQDQDFNFPGLANLVRKARVDLAAEIDFLPDEAVADVLAADGTAPIASLDALRRGRHSREAVASRAGGRPRLITDIARDGLSLAHASLATVTYRDLDADGTELEPTYGLLLYVKPSLDGDESADVREYHRTHPDFPHESTGDQFFDEAQWESYRTLGQHIAERLFTSGLGLSAILRSVSAEKDPSLPANVGRAP